MNNKLQKSGREISAKNREHLDSAKASLAAISAHLEVAKGHLNAVSSDGDPDVELALSAARRKLKVAELTLDGMGVTFGQKH
jgi:hypothetical protein